MKCLLDTHVWLWAHLDPSKIGRKARGVLEADDTELWLSPVSVWETLVLARKGRIALDGGPAWVDRALAHAPMLEAPLTFAVAKQSRSLPFRHEDPADRFLAATARVFDLVFVTADRRLRRGLDWKWLRADR